MISGGVAKPLLEASGLPLATLGEIWNIADADNTGFLNQYSFCVAMRLIGHAQNGEVIDDHIANKVAPLAKFGTIQSNATGGSAQFQTQPQAQRIPSANSVTSYASTASNSSAVVPLLSPIQAANFGAMFDKTANNGVLPGEQAKNIFLKARLPISVLEQIWNLVDQNENGQLTRPQFIVAMHLIQCFMNKSLGVLPAVLSDQLWKVAEGTSGTPNSGVGGIPVSGRVSLSPVQAQTSGSATPSATTNLNTWIMSSQQKKQYGAIFDTLDTKKDSFISSSTVANFLMTSKLPNQVLANIWELANLDQSDNFNKQEFSIAMYLVQKKLAGYELPDDTPAELIQSSALEEPAPLAGPNQPVPPPQSFAAARDQAAPQRTASHMDDLLGIFNTAQVVAPAPAPAPATSSHSNGPPPPLPASRLSTHLTGSNWAPTSDFGKNLQKQTLNEEESSDDDDGPENLDLPRVRGAPPAIPGRSNKPHFDSPGPGTDVGGFSNSSNYDAIKSVSPTANNIFTNSALTQAASSSLAAASTVAAGALGSALGGFSNSTPIQKSAAPSYDNSGRAITEQITQASVDIANYSNQVNSLSKQTSVVNAKKEKAQQELNKILKSKEDLLNKLNQLKALHEKETEQVVEVQNLLIQSKEENDQLANQVSVAEAQYHAEQTKKEQLQEQYNEAQKANQAYKERLGTLNAESTDLKQQLVELENRAKQTSNMLAVSEQQVVAQEVQNEELRQRVADVNSHIFQVESKHKLLLEKLESLENENAQLHDNHAEKSIESANKNIEYSNAFSDAISKGVVVDDELTQVNNDEEVPTASLDEFDDGFTGLKPAKVEKSTTPTENNVEPSDTSSSVMSMSKQTNTTSPTQMDSDLDDVYHQIEGQAEDISLPYPIAHSETSSTQNNPSQSVRDDAEVEPENDSTSTIEQTGPLSSQILPEGSNQEPSANEESPESFEMINHPYKHADSGEDNIIPHSASPVTAQDERSIHTETETIEEPQQAKSTHQEKDEFPPIQELQPLDGSSSSSSSSSDSAENFQDASFSNDSIQNSGAIEPPVANVEKSDGTTGPTKNPFSNQSLSASKPSQDSGVSIFDDLGLETAAVEDNTDAFDNVQSGIDGAGFSFANNELTEATESQGGDDWEQVFAGFGNDPNLQPATVEHSGSNEFTQSEMSGFSGVPSGVSYTEEKFTESQLLAIEELSDMGFDKEDAVRALKLKNWVIDDASNYLLDKA